MKADRFKSLPMHHIDTSVILEPENTENGFYCKKYLNLVGYKYRGKFSFLVLGEIFFHLLKFKTFDEKYDFLHSILNLIATRKISYHSVAGNEGTSSRIREINERIEKTDRLILASAIEDRATAFVTLDSKLINNEYLEKEFRIKIKHPKDLVDL